MSIISKTSSNPQPFLLQCVVLPNSEEGSFLCVPPAMEGMSPSMSVFLSPQQRTLYVPRNSMKWSNLGRRRAVPQQWRAPSDRKDWNCGWQSTKEHSMCRNYTCKSHTRPSLSGSRTVGPSCSWHWAPPSDAGLTQCSHPEAPLLVKY